MPTPTGVILKRIEDEVLYGFRTKYEAPSQRLQKFIVPRWVLERGRAGHFAHAIDCQPEALEDFWSKFFRQGPVRANKPEPFARWLGIPLAATKCGSPAGRQNSVTIVSRASKLGGKPVSRPVLPSPDTDVRTFYDRLRYSRWRGT